MKPRRDVEADGRKCFAVSNVHVWRFCWLCALLASSLMAGTGHPFRAIAAQINIAGAAQQVFRSSNLSFSARVAHSDPLQNAREYRFYEEPVQLDIILTIGHHTEDVATADRELFARQLRVAMKDDNNRPIAIETAGTFWRLLLGLTRVELGPAEPLQIALGRAIEWDIRLRRADGQHFSTGRYTIDLSLAGPFATLRLDDGSAPRSLSSETALTIHLGPPTSARERGRMHALAAQEAMQGRRYAEAAAAARRAIDADPSNASAYAALGGAALQLDQCREAAAALEKWLTYPVGRDRAAPTLAQAYVCAGDEENARRVLRLQGISEDRFDAELGRLRQLVESMRRHNRPKEP